MSADAVQEIYFTGDICQPCDCLCDSLFSSLGNKGWFKMYTISIWSLLNNSGLDGRGLSVCWNPDCRCRRLLPKSRRLPFSGFLPLDISSPAVGDIFRSGRCRCVCCKGNETSRGRNPENGWCRDFGRRRWHRQSGFQHTNRPQPSSPELFNKDHNAGS